MSNPLASFGGWVAGNSASGAGGVISNSVSASTNYLVQTELLSVPEIYLLYLNGVISYDYWHHLLRLKGWVHQAVAEDFFQLIRRNPQTGLLVYSDNYPNQPVHANDSTFKFNKNWPSYQELNVLVNRGILDVNTAKHLMKQTVPGEPLLGEAFSELRFEIPGPSDLVRFAVRDVFNPEIVKKYGYHKEFPIPIEPWMRKQGYGQDTGVIIPGGATTTNGPDDREKATWMDMYWWSHWDLPSVGQGYQMMQRFYVDSDYGPSPETNFDTVFGNVDMEELLKTQDYPEYWRKRMIAMSYNVLTRVDTRRMYELNVLDDSGVYHAYRGQGYNDENAKRLLEFSKVLKNKKKTKDITLESLAEIEDGYINGIYNREEAKTYITALDYTLADAEIRMSLIDVKEDRKHIKRMLGLIKKAYVNGNYSDDDLLGALGNLGIEEKIKNKLIERWKLERLIEYKYISATEAIRIYKKRLVDEDQLRIKLLNLGYSLAEATTLITEAKFDLVIAYQKRIAIAKKELKKEFDNVNKQLETLLKSMEREDTECQKEIKRRLKGYTKDVIKAYTDKNIVSFYKGGYITKDQISEILFAKGFDEEGVIAWIATYIEPLDLQEETSNGENENE